MTTINSIHEVEGDLTLATARDYAARLLALETRGGDTHAALARLERRYGLGQRTIDHLRHGRAKSCDISLFARLRAAYLDLCERQLRKLEAEIAALKSMGSVDAVEDIATAVSRLAAELEEAKGKLNG